MPVEMATRLRRTPKGIGAEIRDRLYVTLERDAGSKETARLIDAVEWMANEMERQSLAWTVSAKARVAMLTAVQTWMELNKSPDYSQAVEDLFGPDDPETLGRSIARLVVRVSKANAQVFEELSKKYGDKR